MSSAYIGVKEVRGQVPGTTRGRARTKSAINNTQTSGYVRAREGVARCLSKPKPRGTKAWRQSLAPHTQKGQRPDTPEGRVTLQNENETRL